MCVCVGGVWVRDRGGTVQVFYAFYVVLTSSKGA